MSETIDTSLDRLANGVSAGDRLTLSTILETGLPYMDEAQIDRTRTLCAEVFTNHARKVSAGSAPQPRQQGAQPVRGYGGTDLSGARQPQRDDGEPDPREYAI